MRDSTEHLTIRQLADVPVVAFSRTEITDPQYVEQTQEALYELVKAQRPEVMVVDLTAVSHMSSIAFGMLALLARVMGEHEGTVYLTGVSEPLLSILHMLQLDQMAPVFATAEEAVESLAD